MFESAQESVVSQCSTRADVLCESRSSLGLHTDLYEIAMAYGYWKNGMADMEACFSAFFRENPCNGGFTLVCGTGCLSSLIEHFVFSDDDIAYLASVEAPGGGKMFPRDFLRWLAQWKPCLDVDVLPDGELAFPREPIVRVTGPIIDCQLIESALLNIVNFESLIATKAARICLAAQGRPVAEFGLRRAQGPNGALSAARAAYIGGCSSTSNVHAARTFGITPSGTHAHSWVMAFEDELSAFRAYARTAPNNCTLLVDTYDVCEGVQHAITVGHEMESCGQRLSAIRIDSGDLCALSRQARTMLDEAGLDYVKIILSNDLDEYLIESLLNQGACVDGFGVGTKLTTSFDQPALSGVYKLCAKRHKTDEWTAVLKVSEQVYKRTIPGIQDLVRFFGSDGVPVADMICQRGFSDFASPTIVDVNDPLLTRTLHDLEPRRILAPCMQAGKRLDPDETSERARARALHNLSLLPVACKRLLNPQVYPVGLEQSLAQLREKMIARVQQERKSPTWR